MDLMKQEEIIEGNKLIAEFMGGVTEFRKGPNNSLWCSCQQEDRNMLFYPPKGIVPNSIEIRFHSSWDWLMPVVDKIEKMLFYPKDIPELGCKFYFIITNKFVSINGVAAGYPANKTDIINSKLEAVFKAVIEFIKWYNEKGM